MTDPADASARRAADRGAGDFDYESRGHGYEHHRRGDPRIGALIHEALGDAATVINVGAGAGSYEPRDRHVVAVEPSAAMRARRRARVPAVDAVAEALPFDTGAFEAAMATVTIHQWRDTVAGLREMRRVSSGPVVILTFDGDALADFWLAEYAPELIEADRRRCPPIDLIRSTLGGSTRVQPVDIPADCTDGFGEAFYARPEMLLAAEVRGAQSGWGFVDADAELRAVSRLAADLEDGTWDRRHGHLRDQPTFSGALRLVVAHP